MSVALTAFSPARRYALPWTPRPEESRRFQRITRWTLGVTLLLALIVSFIPLPELPNDLVHEVPDRFARLVEAKRPPPPPDERVVPVEPETMPAVAEPVEPVKPVEPQPKRSATVREAPVERPAPRVSARDKAAQSGLLPLQNRLAALRDNAALDKATQTRNLTGRVGETTRAERSLVTSNVGAASNGINTASLSRGYGAGGGALEGHETTEVQGSFGAGGGRAAGSTSPSGSGGAASRSREEIELVFDRNKSAIYALYSRALRNNPQLQGKLVLELTIAPDGHVTDCRVVSSELGDADLERKLIARVKMFRFEDKDVATVTTTKPIDFFPA